MKMTNKFLRKTPDSYLATKILITFIFVIGFYANTACSKKENKEIWPPVPPIELPFDVQKVGNKIETEFQIIDHSHRLFALNLNYLFSDQITRKRAWELSGGNGGRQDVSEKSNLR